MESEDWWGQVKNHIPLILGIATAIYISLRLLTVSAFDLETAYGILQAIGIGAVLVGTLTALIAPVSLTIGLSLVAIYLKPMGIFDSGWVLSFGLLFTAVGILTLPIDGLIFTYLPMIAVIAAISFKDKRLNWSRLQAGLIALTIFSVIIPQLLIPIWLPTEYLTLKNSKHAIEAYVLSENAVDVTILITRPEMVEHIKPDEIITRTPCEPSSPTIHEPLARIIFPLESAHYPRCPSAYGIG